MQEENKQAIEQQTQEPLIAVGENGAERPEEEYPARRNRQKRRRTNRRRNQSPAVGAIFCIWCVADTFCIWRISC